MKQTAVEWLFKQISTSKHFYNLMEDINSRSTVAQSDIIEQAKEMEKSQIIEFHKWMLENVTLENAERFFHFSDTDMLNEYLKAQKL